MYKLIPPVNYRIIVQHFMSNGKQNVQIMGLMCRLYKLSKKREHAIAHIDAHIALSRYTS